jgi:TRAP-type C4-dicarboxylate transport system permease small subunit
MKIVKVVLILFGTVMTILVIMNVILRKVFNSGLSWSEEASRFLFIWVTFLGSILANNAALHGEHMRMDFIVEKLTGVPRKLVEVVALLIVLVILGTLFIGGVEVVQQTWPFLTSALEIPRGAVYLCAPIGFGYMFIQTLTKLVNVIKASNHELNHKEAE